MQPEAMFDLLHQAPHMEEAAIVSSLQELKVERFDLLVALVKKLRPSSAAIKFPGRISDCCGTGGSGLSRLNTSTLAAFCVASLGMGVVKFGGRGASGRCGSVDFLDQLGVSFLTNQTQLVQENFQQTHLAFLAAPDFYPQFKALARARKIYGKRTIFNLAGPLLNPSLPDYQVIGVPRLDSNYLAAMSELNLKVWMLSSDLGLDEAVPGQTRLLKSKAAPDLPTEEELQAGADYLFNRYSVVSPQAYLSDRPVEDGRAFLTGEGKLAHRALVIWNAAIIMRMRESVELLELVQRLSQHVEDGGVANYYSQLKLKMKSGDGV